MPKNRLVILSGPSCVGKTPLLRALAGQYPQLRYGSVVLYTSRQPRSLEKDGVDFHFRDESFIRNLPPERYIVGRVRHIWQALDLRELKKTFKSQSLILLELHPDLAEILTANPQIQRLLAGYELITVFIAPLSTVEIQALQQGMSDTSAQDVVAAVMTPKLISRALQQGVTLSPDALEDIRIRSSHAYDEMRAGEKYDYTIVNHDGEDSLHWRFKPPIGEAGATLQRLKSILIGEG